MERKCGKVCVKTEFLRKFLEAESWVYGLQLRTDRRGKQLAGARLSKIDLSEWAAGAFQEKKVTLTFCAPTITINKSSGWSGWTWTGPSWVCRRPLCMMWIHTSLYMPWKYYTTVGAWEESRRTSTRHPRMAIFSHLPWNTSGLAMCGTPGGYGDPTRLGGKPENIANPQNSTLSGVGMKLYCFSRGSLEAQKELHCEIDTQAASSMLVSNAVRKVTKTENVLTRSH